MPSSAVRLAAPRFPRGSQAGHPWWQGERGSVSVETALAMFSLVTVIALMFGGGAVVVAQVRCVDAASEAARLAARGDQARAVEAARRIAPAGARIEIAISGDEVIARVSARPVGDLLPSLSLDAEAMAVLEPGVAGAP